MPLCLRAPMGAGCRSASGGVPGGGHGLVALPMCRARRLCRRGRGGAGSVPRVAPRHRQKVAAGWWARGTVAGGHRGPPKWLMGCPQALRRGTQPAATSWLPLRIPGSAVSLSAWCPRGGWGVLAPSPALDKGLGTKASGVGRHLPAGGICLARGEVEGGEEAAFQSVLLFVNPSKPPQCPPRLQLQRGSVVPFERALGPLQPARPLPRGSPGGKKREDGEGKRPVQPGGGSRSLQELSPSSAPLWVWKSRMPQPPGTDCWAKGKLGN